jgi:heptosyltransferase-1
MGDILHALPAVTALRQAHPEWVIDWVVEPRWQALLTAESKSLQGVKSLLSFPSTDSAASAMPFQSGRNPAQPLVDHLHLAPTRDWGKAPLSSKTFHEIKTLRTDLRAAKYDAVIDLQGSIRSAVVARLAGCPRVIGEARPRETLARWLFSERITTGGAHVIEQDVELASAIAGDKLTPMQPWLPTDPVAEAWAAKVLPPNTGARGGDQQAVLINPGAGWGAKRWPVQRYDAVAQGFIDLGFRILVNAGPGEEKLAEVIARGTGGAAIPLTCTVAQLIAITRRVALVVAGDTGPLHLACALGRPVIGIYGPTDPSRNGPYGTKFRVIRNPQSRRDHTRRDSPEEGLLTIQPDDVLRAADALLYPETTPESEP